ncbi:unnamed protein product [Musa acuminata subsp. burmannicoides]
MRIDGELAKQKGSGEVAKEKNRWCSRKKSKRQQKKALAEPMPTVVQRLWETCKEVFADSGPGVVPLPGDVGHLRSFLDGMKPADVGLHPNLPFFQDFKGTPPVTYLHLHQCPKFSIGIFCLPQAAVIPLHNHPGMTVFSKLLFGSMHIRSYDWVDSSKQIRSSNGACLAKLNTDSVMNAPCETSILYPAAGGNMHCFTAVTPCAVLDVLGPPYNGPEGRDCKYYTEVLCSNFPGNAAASAAPADNDRYAWLEERQGKPDDFKVRGEEYKGPKIVGYY